MKKLILSAAVAFAAVTTTASADFFGDLFGKVEGVAAGVIGKVDSDVVEGAAHLGGKAARKGLEGFGAEGGKAGADIVKGAISAFK